MPRGYSGAPAPLVLGLHARGGSGAQLVDAWGLGALADAKGFLLVAPHFPELLPAWGEAVWRFLAANPKP